MTSTTLTAAAFGCDPECWPLPTAQSREDLWLRAVAAGGQGRYSSARADLDAVLRTTATGPLAALALSTHASFLRQLGGHRLARGWDGRALALAAVAGDSPRAQEARVDALIGLAADALGVGRLALSHAVLDRAAAELANTDAPPPRLAIRLEWVRAELAMAGGQGDTALRHAERGVELAESTGPALVRHRIKSDVVLAAALCSAGLPERSRTVADAALADTLTHGLIPLRWALACLLFDIGSTTLTSQHVSVIRDECADVITRRGGLWSPG